jgi:hypothetical protein
MVVLKEPHPNDLAIDLKSALLNIDRLAHKKIRERINATMY